MLLDAYIGQPRQPDGKTTLSAPSILRPANLGVAHPRPKRKAARGRQKLAYASI